MLSFDFTHVECLIADYSIAVCMPVNQQQVDGCKQQTSFDVLKPRKSYFVVVYVEVKMAVYLLAA